MFSFFGAKELTPTEQVRKWKREVNKQIREIERSVRNITLEENKAKAEIKKLVKRGDKQSILPLAKEMVNSKKAKTRLYESRANLNTVKMQLQANLATVKVAGCLEKSTVVLQSMNKLIKLPALMETMRDMAREMERAGFIDEMIDDTLDMIEDDDIEEQTDAEVQKVLMELTDGLFDGAEVAPTAIPSAEEVTPAAASALPPTPDEVAADRIVEEKITSMKKRLEAL